MRIDDPASTRNLDEPPAPPGRTSWRIGSLALGLLVPVTSLAVVSISWWLLPPYLIVMAWVLFAPSRDETPETTDSSGSEEELAQVSAIAAEPAASWFSPAIAASGGPGSVSGSEEMAGDPAPVALAETTPPKRRRGKGRGKGKSKAVIEPPSVTWVRVGPGKFVRAEGSADSTSAVPSPPDPTATGGGGPPQLDFRAPGASVEEEATVATADEAACDEVAAESPAVTPAAAAPAAPPGEEPTAPAFDPVSAPEAAPLDLGRGEDSEPLPEPAPAEPNPVGPPDPEDATLPEPEPDVALPAAAGSVPGVEALFSNPDPTGAEEADGAESPGGDQVDPHEPSKDDPPPIERPAPLREEPGRAAPIEDADPSTTAEADQVEPHPDEPQELPSWAPPEPPAERDEGEEVEPGEDSWLAEVAASPTAGLDESRPVPDPEETTEADGLSPVPPDRVWFVDLSASPTTAAGPTPAATPWPRSHLFARSLGNRVGPPLRGRNRRPLQSVPNPRTSRRGPLRRNEPSRRGTRATLPRAPPQPAQLPPLASRLPSPWAWGARLAPNRDRGPGRTLGLPRLRPAGPSADLPPKKPRSLIKVEKKQKNG